MDGEGDNAPETGTGKRDEKGEKSDEQAAIV
jgi:hypothetical protein